MDEKVFVRVAMSEKTKRKFWCVVIKYDNGNREKFVFLKNEDYCLLLDITPRTLQELALGDYSIN